MTSASAACRYTGASSASARSQKGPKAVVVEVLAVGVSEDHDALQPELAHRPLQFVGTRLRVLQRHAGKARVARGVLADESGQEVVGLARQLQGRGGVEHALHHAHAGKHGQVDAGGRHGLQPPLAHVGDDGTELVDGGSGRVGDQGEPAFEVGGFVEDEVFF